MNWMMVGMLPATIVVLIFFKVDYKRLELDSDNGVTVSKFDTFGLYWNQVERLVMNLKITFFKVLYFNEEGE